MKLVSRKWLQIGASLAAALIICNLVLTLHNARQLVADGQMVSHAHRAQAELVVLQSLVVDAESGQRGFIVAGDESYLRPYDNAIDRVEDQLDIVSQSTVSDPISRKLVPELRERIGNRLRTLEQGIEFRKGGEIGLAVSLVSSDIGTSEMRKVRDLIGDLLAREREVLGDRVRSESVTYWTTLLTGLGSGIAALALLGLFSFMSLRYVDERDARASSAFEFSERMRTTLASIGDAVVTTDAEQKITNLNPVAESLTGWSCEEAIGKHLDEVFQILSETTRKPVTNPATRALREGIVVGLANHTLLVRRDGSEVPIDDSAAPIRLTDGTITGCVLVFRDVSERREHEGRLLWSEQMFRNTFDYAPVGIAHMALDGALLRVNDKLCEILGFTRDELQSFTNQAITHPLDLKNDEGFAGKLLSGVLPTASYEKRFISKFGEVVWVNTTVTPIRDGNQEPEYFLAIIEDIREWRAAEETRIRMAAIIDSSNDAIIGKTFEGIVTSWNPAAERLFGYTESEMIGQTILKIVPEQNREEELRLVKQLKDGLRVDQHETIRVCKSGKPIDVVLNISPINDSSGRPVGVSTIVRDITERKRAAESLRESETRFRTLADNMSQFAWMADKEGSIYWFNNRWYDYTGGTLEEMQGSCWQKVVHPDHVDRVMANMQHSWKTGEPWEDTFPICGKDSQYRWFLSRALPIRDDKGDIATWFGSNTDITELKEYEETSHQARVAAESANSSRGEFLANMSHEIRTPMTAILGHADILLEHIQDPDNLQAVDTIRRNGKFLLQIINDILDLSKIDAGRFLVDHERVEPDSILADVHSLMDVRAQEKRIEFNMAIEGKLPQSIETDAVRLRQILLNLVGNALKFTDRGTVSLAARYLADSNKLQFEVRDTGIGISADDIDKLFNPFMQADTSSTRAYEGTGLGLAISRRLAQALGGDISVRSELGKGSVFTLTIDCGSLANVYFIEPSLTHKRTKENDTVFVRIDGCILVVDDRRDIRFLAQHFIEKAGGKVVTATNGQEAIDMLTHPDPDQCTVDVVVMDMQMPIMDGYVAAQKLRQYGFRKPIIALTANAMKDDRKKCLAAGCNDYATKPLDGPKLVQMIAHYLNTSPADCKR